MAKLVSVGLQPANLLELGLTKAKSIESQRLINMRNPLTVPLCLEQRDRSFRGLKSRNNTNSTSWQSLFSSWLLESKTSCMWGGGFYLERGLSHKLPELPIKLCRAEIDVSSVAEKLFHCLDTWFIGASISGPMNCKNKQRTQPPNGLVRWWVEKHTFVWTAVSGPVHSNVWFVFSFMCMSSEDWHLEFRYEWWRWIDLILCQSFVHYQLWRDLNHSFASSNPQQEFSLLHGLVTTNWPSSYFSIMWYTIFCVTAWFKSSCTIENNKFGEDNSFFGNEIAFIKYDKRNFDSRKIIPPKSCL